MEIEGVATCSCGLQQRVFRLRPDPDVGADPPPSLPPGSQVACAYHARNTAAHTCHRCGSFICTLCSLRLSRVIYCPPCLQRLRRDEALPELRSRFPRPHTQALWLAAMGLLLLPLALVLAPLAVALGWRAWKRRAVLAEREPYLGVQVLAAMLLAVASVGAELALLGQMVLGSFR